MSYTESGADELRAAGWDPEWIVKDPERLGPWVVVQVPDERCSRCGGAAPGWTVLDMYTATGGSATWTGGGAEEHATNLADSLNQAWRSGWDAAGGGSLVIEPPETLEGGDE